METVNAAVTATEPAMATVLLPTLVLTALATMLLVRVPVLALAAMAIGIVIVHEPFAGMVPAVAVIDVPPTGAVIVDPQSPGPTIGAPLTVNPVPIDVNKSLNDVIVAAVEVRLLSVIVIVVEPPCTAGVVNALLPVIALTDNVPVAAAKATPLKLPAGIVLAVDAVAVTGAVMVQVVDPAPTGAAATDPPVNVTDVAVLVSVPPQVVDGAPVKLIVAAQVSVNVTGVSTVALKFATVIVSVDGPDGAIGVGAKALVTCAPVCTLMLAAMAGLVTPSAVVSAPAAIVLV